MDAYLGMTIGLHYVHDCKLRDYSKLIMSTLSSAYSLSFSI